MNLFEFVKHFVAAHVVEPSPELFGLVGFGWLKQVLRIRVILVRIRRLLINGSGSGRPKNIRFQIPNTGTFTSFFKDKQSQRSRKIIEIKIYSYYFCLMMEVSECGSGEAQKHTDPTDSDPQHCVKH